MDNILQYMPEIEILKDSEKEELNEFFMSVKLISEKSWNIEFNNRDMYHAAIVMAQIFQTAKKEIKIFAGNFKGDICGKTIYKSNLKNALINKQVKLTVVFETYPSPEFEGYKLLKHLKEIKPENIEVRLLTKSFKATFNEDELNHFTIADDSIFRYELDKNNYRAFCNFDDKKLVEKLSANYEILVYNSEPLNL